MAKTKIYLDVKKAPFWFTTDQSIYINFLSKVVEVDMEKLSEEAKKEVDEALKNKRIFLSQEELTQEHTVPVIIPKEEKITEISEETYKVLTLGGVKDLVEKVDTKELLERIALLEKGRAAPRISVLRLVASKIPEVEKLNAVTATKEN